MTLEEERQITYKRVKKLMSNEFVDEDEIMYDYKKVRLSSILLKLLRTHHIALV